MQQIKHISIFLSACILLALTACKKDKEDPLPGTPPSTPYTCASCVKSPEGKPEYNSSSRGIYKGILVASTGTIRFNVGNDGSTINAIMVIDGTTVHLSSSITWEDGAHYVAPFTGVMNNEPVSITFSVQADGSNPVVAASSIPGHPNAAFTLAKETSNALIEGFEGTYSRSDGEKGTFNILLSRALEKWGGVARENGSSDDDHINGSLNGSKILDEDGRNVGTLSNDEISGSFSDGDGRTVTISGKRTL
jgi:hypothetical protein